MIFPAPVCRLILSGRKTQHRYPIQTGERRPPYKPGHVYSIQPAAGRKAYGQIRITSSHQETLDSLSWQDAKAEGHKTREDCLAAYNGSQSVRGRVVWVVAFQVAADEPRLLTPSAKPAGTEHGYTSNPSLAMLDEPEALTDVQLRELVALRPALGVLRNGSRFDSSLDVIRRELDSMQADLRNGSWTRSQKAQLRLLRRQVDKFNEL